MHSERRITKLLFAAFAREAATRGCLFGPISAGIVHNHCQTAAQQLRFRAKERFSDKLGREEWLAGQLLEVGAEHIPRAVRRMASSAKKHGHKEGGFLVIHENDSGPTFLRLCPGFWPFC